MVWVAAVVAATTASISRCEEERLAEPQPTSDDKAYEQAITDCVAAIQRMVTNGDVTPGAHPVQRRINALRQELQMLLDTESHSAAGALRQVKDECLKLALAGKPLDAVRQYRFHTGLSLREAKDAVDNLVAEARSSTD